jgi:hypothetical protein
MITRFGGFSFASFRLQDIAVAIKTYAPMRNNTVLNYGGRSKPAASPGRFQVSVSTGARFTGGPVLPHHQRLNALMVRITLLQNFLKPRPSQSKGRLIP